MLKSRKLGYSYLEIETVVQVFTRKELGWFQYTGMVLSLLIIPLKYAVARTGHDLDTSACTSGCAPISTAGSSTKESVNAVSGHFEVHVHPDIYIQIVWCPDVSHERKILVSNGLH